MLTKTRINKLRKQGYRIIGNHSSIKVCLWTKKALRNEGACYKNKFYGIDSWRCVQMTPSFVCPNRCLFCWRDINFTPTKWNFPIDDPKTIIDNCIKEHVKYLQGFNGSSKTNRKRFAEAQSPKHMAISLSAEPTFYPRLPELIKELRKRKMTSFLVTNGLLPEVLEKLQKQNALPTQLYVSLSYPNEKIFRQITKNKTKNAWKKLNKTLNLFTKLKIRKVIRMTLVKGENSNMKDEFVKEYAELIKKAMPDFLEIKGYMAVGFARNRKGMGYDAMPTHEEIKDFAKKIAKELEKPGLKYYKILDEHEFSRVVLIGRDKKKMKIRMSEI